MGEIKVMCDDCVHSNSCKVKDGREGDRKITACSMYDKTPETIPGWVVYFWHKVKNRASYKAYRVKCWLAWMRYSCLVCKRIPSIVSPGDVIKFKYDDVLAKNLGEEPGVEHEMKIHRVWVAYGHNGKSENGIIDKFYLMADTSCGQSTLNSLLHRKCIISINGKDSVPNWNW